MGNKQRKLWSVFWVKLNYNINIQITMIVYRSGNWWLKKNAFCRKIQLDKEKRNTTMTKTDWDWHAPKSVKRFFDFYLEDASTPENGIETRNGRTRNVAMIKMFQNVRGPVSSQRIVYACGKGDILGDGWFPREMTPVWETSAEIPYWWRVTTQIWLVLLIG